jgi:hypothetical protein
MSSKLKRCIRIVGVCMSGKPSVECYKFMEFWPLESMNCLLNVSITTTLGILDPEENETTMEVFILVDVSGILEQRSTGTCQESKSVFFHGVDV